MSAVRVWVFAPVLFEPVGAGAQENGRSLADFPINLVASDVYHFSHQPVQLSVGGRVYADSPAGGPDWGMPWRHSVSNSG
jgi:hypothetical protein